MKIAPTMSVVVLCVISLAGWASAAEPLPATNAPASATERFLVIVETSAAMQKRAENVQKVVGSVISSGLKGQMESGSTVGLWTFNEKLFTGQIPLQLWTTNTRQRVALTMVQLLQQQKQEKNSRLAAAWEAATNVIANSDYITLMLITSGNEPVVGTPFDAAIAESFIKNEEQQRKGNMPFLTILRAVQGKFVAYAVNMPPWPLEVPEYPAGLKPVAPPTAPPVAPALPVPVAKRVDPAILSPTNTIYLVETATPVEAPIVAPAPKVGPTNVVPTVAEMTKASSTNSPVAAARTEVAGGNMSEQKLAATTNPAVPRGKGKFPVVTVLIAGICVLLSVLVIFIALLRWSRRSAGESLITRSMSQNDH